MKHFKVLVIGLIGAALLLSFKADSAEKLKYKCLIQMVNYTGEGAYIIVSIIDPDGQYDETIRILGDDPEWYEEIDEWWSFFGKEQRNTDGITGATLSGGERTVSVLEIDPTKMDAGYTLRFETSVEDQEYHIRDIEIPLTSATIADKVEGIGYIRYVRLMPQ